MPADLTPETCDGSEQCAARTHEHGCFADYGQCNEPQDHTPSAVPGAGEVERVTVALEAAWAKAEPGHSITKHPVAYRATFADLARAAITALRDGEVGGE